MSGSPDAAIGSSAGTAGWTGHMRAVWSSNASPEPLSRGRALCRVSEARHLHAIEHCGSYRRELVMLWVAILVQSSRRPCLHANTKP